MYLVFKFYRSQIVLFFIYLWEGTLLHSALFFFFLLSPHRFPGFCSPSLLPLTVMFPLAEGEFSWKIPPCISVVFIVDVSLSIGMCDVNCLQRMPIYLPFFPGSFLHVKLSFKNYFEFGATRLPHFRTMQFFLLLCVLSVVLCFRLFEIRDR